MATSSGSDTTIIYCTDNSLDGEIRDVCLGWLERNREGIPVVSVSQEPMDLGANVCVGRIGRSWLSLYRQLFAGVRKARSRWVAITEHDCVYSPEHFRWIPPRDDTFYYNDNVWLLQWKSTKPELDGMYSRWPRRYALSQLVCSRDLLLRTIDRRLDLIDQDRGMIREFKYAGEPGRTRVNLDRLRRRAASGSKAYLRPLIEQLVGKMEEERAEMFRTRTPNLDIRHGGNFTGPKRGRNRRWSLAPWGELKDVIEGGGTTWQT